MRMIRGIAVGDNIEVIADDRAFPADVAAWCKKTNNVLIRLDTRTDGHFAIVQKGPASP
jgi:TusA-related sulfurtransferase